MADVRLQASGRRPLTFGIALVMTAIAFEALAVTTALPVVVKDLGGLRLYGWAFSGFMLANLVGITLTGPVADRIGPLRPALGGLALFAGGLGVSGAAPTMLVVVVGRVVAGLGAGTLVSVAYVVIGLGYPEARRARMFAILSSAWVLPSLFGPLIAGTVAQHFGWRWVFFGLMPLMVLDACLIVPPLRSLRPAAPGDGAPHTPIPFADATRLAAGAGLVLGGIGARSALGAAVAVAGFFVAQRPFARLVPAGTLRARGTLPTAIALRGLTAFAFFTFDAFLPLTLTTLRHQSPTHAALTLTAGGVSWAAGSWVQERRGARWGRRRTAVTGVLLLMAGMAVASLIFVRSAPVLLAPLGWLLSGLGMGLCYPTTSLTVLAEAPEGRVGSASSALQLCDVLGVAIGTGLGGAAVAVAASSHWGTRHGLEVADLLSFLVGGLALVTARRLPASAAGRPAAATAPVA
ncbi:MAG TPA: MFS transporter [Acidimicrobiales bacterium]|nr:MFS transporter [Acidimicrobiales bacterium]